VALRLEGDLGISALAAALRDVITRHEVLRTVFPVVDGQPYQRVLALDELGWELPVTEVAEPDLPGAVAQTAEQPFDLAAQQVPVRARLLRAAPDVHVLVIVLHHVATDGMRSSSPSTWRQRPGRNAINAGVSTRPLPRQLATNTVPARLIQARDDESNAGMSLTSVARNVVSTFGATVSAAWRISANSFSRLTASFAGFTGTQSAQSAGTMSGAIGAPCGSSAICLSVEGI
jgi:hypothetical protein